MPVAGARTLPPPRGRPDLATVERHHPIVRTAFASTYPPRRCGIAAFTQSLAAATESREIVALHHVQQTERYPLEVHHRVRRDVRADYSAVARSLGACVDVASIQHDYGIWGGEDGSHVLDFVGALDVPAVATLHTVRQYPTVRQRAILTSLVGAVATTVVMSRAAAARLTSTYGVDPARVEVIPHGVPDLPLVESAALKEALGLTGREVLLSFGLLARGKGYELAIEALPAVVKAHPNVCYVVVGATHPDELAREGETYRTSLLARVTALGLNDHVRFVDRFVGRVELVRWLEAADVFVTPNGDLDQIVSGTLSYAMGAGRAIVSTPYAAAAELLGDGRGVLVPPGSPSQLASAIVEVLGDPDLRSSLGATAYAHSRRMVWSEVAGDYRRLFDRISTQANLVAAQMPFAAAHA